MKTGIIGVNLNLQALREVVRIRFKKGPARRYVSCQEMHALFS